MSIDDLQEVVHGLFKEPIIGSLKPKMAEILHLENRHDIIFFSAESGPIWTKFRRLVVMWSKSKPDVEFQYGGRFNGMSAQSPLPHCRVLPPGEFNGISRVTLQGAATW